MSQQWYYSVDGGKTRVGPVAAGQLMALAQSRGLLPTHLVWSEGMTQWRPASTVKGLFASAASGPAPQPVLAPANAAPSANAAAPGASAPTQAAALPTASALTIFAQATARWQRLPKPAKIGVMAGGALLGIVLLSWGLIGLLTRGGGSAVVVETDATRFEVGLKDVWHSDLPANPFDFHDAKPGGNVVKKRRCLVVVYYYKNLGPREASFHFNAEVQTAKGHLFPVHHAFKPWDVTGKTNPVGGWQPKHTEKINDTGEGAIAFALPDGEVPIRLVIGGAWSESPKLNMKLPDGPFKVRIRSHFGFLPANLTEAVPGLLKFLKPAEWDVAWKETAVEAAKTLGEIGSDAKEAIPELDRLLAKIQPKARFHSGFEDDISAVADAIRRISGPGVDVSGEVKGSDGEPVPGIVKFKYADGTTRQGATSYEGSYKIFCAPAGKVHVAFSPYYPDTKNVPDRYLAFETARLTRQIELGEARTLDFDLKD